MRVSLDEVRVGSQVNVAQCRDFLRTLVILRHSRVFRTAFQKPAQTFIHPVETPGVVNRIIKVPRYTQVIEAIVGEKRGLAFPYCCDIENTFPCR